MGQSRFIILRQLLVPRYSWKQEWRTYSLLGWINYHRQTGSECCQCN